MTDFIVVVILAVVIGAAVRYMYKAKKSGAACIGCPVGGCCSGKNGGTCSCGNGEAGRKTASCSCHADVG